LLIKSNGRENKPNPPKIISKIQPAKEQIAIVYTKIELSNAML
jgi:hypothetical protein